jgi:hypothetical protein
MPVQNGGAVREIEKDRISQAYKGAFNLTASEDLISDVAHHLRIRIVDVDNPPDGATKRQADAVANAAKRLLDNLQKMPGSQSLLSEIAWHNPNRPMDTNDLYRWLQFLQHPSSFGEVKSPATAYRSTIRAVALACAKDGAVVSKTEGGAFLKFLEGLEAAWPSLIFPTGTIPQGRHSYVRESLKG